MTTPPSTALERMRALPSLPRAHVLRRDPAIHRFWEEHQASLVEAWQEWEARADVPVLDDRLFASPIRAAVGRAWSDPTAEQGVRDLLEPLAPGVFQVPLFDAEGVATLRGYLAAAEQSGIPVRPPYGIVLNRGGAMLDPRSTGYLAAPSFQHVYRTMMDRYLRPIGRLLFPEVTGYDAQTFGFSIHYRPDTDTSIRPHTDASAVTSNVNLNLPDEAFTGSEVDFYDPATQRATSLVFAPGMAVLHRGNVPHAARPIRSGERTNLVLWVYGAHGAVPWNDEAAPEADAATRWAVPSAEPDGFAPF